MSPVETLLLSRADVATLLSLDDCIAAVDNALRMAGNGLAASPGILGFPSGEGGFHIKAALLGLSRPYFAAKINGNFRRNRERFALPTIQGVIALFDGENGRPLAIMDSIEITLLRTAAATAVAARCLARSDSRVALVCGCGAQGRVQLRALARVLPLERVYAYDSDAATAERFSRELAPILGLEITPTAEPGATLRQCDVCITCTTSRRAFIQAEDVPSGLFIAAVGADSPDKQELDPTILKRSRLVVDSREQCATIGELHHALEAGESRPPLEVTELAEVVAGAKPGRQSSEEVTVFDSTGIALEDVAAAAAVYERAIDTRRGQLWHISDSNQRSSCGSEHASFLMGID